MRNIFILLFSLSCLTFYGQKSCFDNANKYRFQYLDQKDISFDSLTLHLKKGEEMLIGCTMPNDTFTTIKNIHSSINNFSGKVLIINFWSIYCAPCINEIPSFHSLLKKHKGSVAVVAFTLDSKAEISAYLKKHGFNAEIIADAKDFVAKYSLGSGYPFTLLIDKNRKIVFVKSGGTADAEHQMDLYNELDPLIDSVLKQK